MNIKGQEQAPKEKLSSKIKKSTIWAFLSLILFKIVLDLSYYFVISRVWSYAGFELHLNSFKLVESYLLLFIVFAIIPKSLVKLSNILVWLLILLSYIPMLTIFAFKDEDRIFMYVVTAFWITVFLLRYIPGVSILSIKQSKIFLLLLFVVLTGIVFIMIYKYFGLSLNFDLTKVYKIRSRYVEMKIPLAGYLFNWVGYIIFPVLLAIFVKRRKWIYIASIIFLQILVFSTTGNKTFLFAPLFVLTLMWIFKKKNPLAYLASGLVGIILLGMLSYWIIDDVWISSLFTRRTLLDPAQTYFYYYDFYSNNNYTFLSQQRIFQTFLDYPYHLDPPHLIGEIYYNNPKMGANTGIVGDAYMNFGFLGLLLWAILLAIILKLIDMFSKKKDISIGVSAIAMPAITIVNSGLLTNLITHGLLLALVILYLLPKKKAKQVSNHV